MKMFVTALIHILKKLLPNVQKQDKSAQPYDIKSPFDDLSAYSILTQIKLCNISFALKMKNPYDIQ